MVLMTKDRIEKMKWTNEIWHKFQNCLPFSAFLWQFLWKSRDISSSSENIREILRKFHQFFTEKWPKFIDQNRNEMKFHFIPPKKFDDFYLEFWGFSGAKAKKSCRSRKILKNASFLAIVAVDTAENEPLKVWAVSFHYFNPILTRYAVRLSEVHLASLPKTQNAFSNPPMNRATLRQTAARASQICAYLFLLPQPCMAKRPERPRTKR